MISQNEKQQILYLLQSPQWGSVERIADELCKEIKDGDFIGDSEWETLKQMLLRVGEVQGIRRFINELYNQTKDV